MGNSKEAFFEFEDSMKSVPRLSAICYLALKKQPTSPQTQPHNKLQLIVLLVIGE